MTATKPARPRRYESPAGLVVHVNANGSIRRMEHGDIVLNLFPGTRSRAGRPTSICGGSAPTSRRRHSSGRGARSRPRLDAAGLRAPASGTGSASPSTLVLAADSARVVLARHASRTRTDAAVTVDLVYAQDLALAHYGAIRMNEYYVSQYVDHTPLAHPERGCVLAVRQNLAMGGRHPWALIGSLGRGVELRDRRAPAARPRDPRRRGAGGARRAAPRRARAGSTSTRWPCIQDAPLTLAPGAAARRAASSAGSSPITRPSTSDADLACVDRALALPEARRTTDASSRDGGRAPGATLFSAHDAPACRDLTDAEIARASGATSCATSSATTAGCSRSSPARARTSSCGRRSCACCDRTATSCGPATTSRPTRRRSRRPCGWPACSTRCVTQGHVSINRLLSTTRSYLGLQRAHGQRIFVEQRRRLASARRARRPGK